MRPLEGSLDMRQIVGDGLTIEMVDDKTLSAWSCALYLHHTITHIEGNHLPMGTLQFFQLEFQYFFQCLVLG